MSAEARVVGDGATVVLLASSRGIARFDFDDEGEADALVALQKDNRAVSGIAKVSKLKFESFEGVPLKSFFLARFSDSVWVRDDVFLSDCFAVIAKASQPGDDGPAP